MNWVLHYVINNNGKRARNRSPLEKKMYVTITNFHGVGERVQAKIKSLHEASQRSGGLDL